MKKPYVVTFVLMGAALLTLLIFACATDVVARFIGWFGTLSKNKQVVLRTLILFAPLLVIFAGVAARRGRKSDHTGQQ